MVKIFEIREDDRIDEPHKFFYDERDYDDNDGHFDITGREMFNVYTKTIFIFGKKALTLKTTKTKLPYNTKIGNTKFIKTRERERNINKILK
tara:strand:+ start:52 stop:327 length:276 start_codon:yes stop_codon:yes gene_type:complete